MESLSDDFYPAVGFTNRIDLRNYGFMYRFRTRPTQSVFQTIDQRIAGFLATDQDNRIDSSLLMIVPLSLRTQVADSIVFTYQHRFERIEDAFNINSATIQPGAYHFDEGTIRATSSSNRPLRVEFRLTGGTFFAGERVAVFGLVEWRPSAHWLLAFEYDQNWIWQPTSSTKTRIARVRFNIQFTPNIAWITFAQYDNVSDVVGINSRLRWIIQDGREIFIVVNQDVVDVDGNLVAGRTEPLAKIGWTFRF